MPQLEFKSLLDAGVHFGHLRRKWNPNMAPYIFMERNGIHIIDLYKTQAKLEEAGKAVKQIAKSGKKILFVATKKQAKEIVSDKVKRANMPYVVERWPGGMLTNFATIRKAVRKMTSIDKMMKGQAFENISKRERLQITRERAKLEKNLGSISDLNRLPSAIFIVDINKEHIAVAEAKKLNIPTFAIVDTNSNPNAVDFPIPANDDASKSIEVIIEYMIQCIEEGLTERSLERDKKAEEAATAKAEKEAAAKAIAEEEEEEAEDLDAIEARQREAKIKLEDEVEEQKEEKAKKPAKKPVAKKKASDNK